MGTDLSMETLPNDLINSIVPFVDIRDYHNLRLVSKRLLRRLDSTTYGQRYLTFVFWEQDAMRLMFRAYRLFPPKSLPMGAVLDGLKNQTCECGHYAWQVYCFTGPPRRLCSWKSPSPKGRCYPQSVVLSPRLYEIYNLSEDALNDLPVFNPLPIPQRLYLADLKAVEDIARCKLGDKGVTAATAKLLEDPTATFQNSQNNQWELDFLRPIAIGIFPSRSIAAEGAERYAAPMSPLECLICTSRNRETFPNNSVYEHIPHDYEYLRQHIKKHHPEMLGDYERGWFALPEMIRMSWLAEGAGISGTFRYEHRYPQWNGWADTILLQWKGRNASLQHRLILDKANWRMALERIRAYSLPDIRQPRGFASHGEGDMKTILDAYFLMKECKAFEELMSKWGDESTRGELIRETARFWQYEEIYHGATFYP